MSKLYYWAELEEGEGSVIEYYLHLYDGKPVRFEKPVLIVSWWGYKEPAQENEWRGFNLSLSPDTHCPDAVRRAAKVADRLAAGLGLAGKPGYLYLRLRPDNCLDALEGMGAVEMVMDPRLEEFVEADKVEDPQLAGWDAVNENDRVLLSIVADTEEHARKIILEKLAKGSAKDEYYVELFADWAKGGCKVGVGFVSSNEDWAKMARDKAMMLPQPEG